MISDFSLFLYAGRKHYLSETAIMRLHSFTPFRSQAFILVCILFVVSGCKIRSAGPPGSSDSIDTLATETTAYKGKMRNVTFLPYWVSNAQFAGYYVAREKGIYKKYGINLEIIPYEPFNTPSDLISSGKADFAALWLVNAIELKAKGTDIVNIAQPSTRSSAMLLTKKSSGIDSIPQMEGKRVGIWADYELQPKAFFSEYKVNVTIVPIGSTNNLFLAGGVDITIANWFDEYHTIINSGYDPEDLNAFFFADFSLNFLEDGIYCLSDMRENDPQLCADFLKATLEGWRYAFDHKEEAIDIVVQYAHKDKLPVNKVHQGWMLDRYQDLYLPGGKTEFNELLLPQDYTFAGKVLQDAGLIEEIPPYNSFFIPINKN